MVHEVDKGVTDIRLVFVVDWDIEEVVLALIILVDFLQEKPLVVLVRNVLDHDCGAGVFPALYPLNFNIVDGLVTASLRRLRVCVFDTLMRLLDPSPTTEGWPILLLGTLIRDIERGIRRAHSLLIVIYQGHESLLGSSRKSSCHLLLIDRRDIIKV